MSEAQREPVAGRVALIAVVAALTLVVGHFGLRLAAVGFAPGPRGASETRLPAARDIPVPPRSELYAAADAAGDPNRVLLRYVSQAGVDEIADYYRREMPARGWTPRNADAAQKGYPGVVLSYSALAGTWCMITISKMAEGGVGVTVLKMRGVAPRAPERPRKEEPT